MKQLLLVLALLFFSHSANATMPKGGSVSAAVGILPVANGGTGNTSAIAERQRVAYAQSTLNQRDFGDSITQGNSASPLTNGYTYLITGDLNTSDTNYAVSGTQSCDIADAQVFANVSTVTDYANPLTILNEFTNDANFKGAGTYEAVAQNCQKSAIAWLGISNNYKVLGSSAGCVQTGTWTTDSIYNAIGVTSQTNASTLTCTITSYGGVIYAWYRQADSNGGTFTYQLDSGGTTSVSTATTPAIATQNSGVNGVGLIRIPAPASGSHTVTFAVTSTTNASNTVDILGVGTPSPLPTIWQNPTIYVGGVLRQQNNAASAATAAYDQDAQADVLAMQADGINAIYVPSRNYVNSTTDMANSLHPNNTGHLHLAEAYEATMQAIPYAMKYFTGGINNPLSGNTGGSPVSTSTPNSLSLGNTISSTAGANPKFKVYESGATSFGFGVSSQEIDYIVPGTNNFHKFWTNGAVQAAIFTNETDITQELKVLGNTSGASTTPAVISCGTTYSSVAGQNPCLRLYDQGGGNNSFGIGVSSQEMDFVVPSNNNFKFWSGSSNVLTIPNSGATTFPNGLINGGAAFGAVATPKYLDFGGDYGTTPGSDIKVMILNGGGAQYGIGAAAATMDFIGNSGGMSYNFYDSAVNTARIDGNGLISGQGIKSWGTTFTLSANGCGATSLAGGGTAGKLVSGTTGTCTFTVSLPTAANGWSCWANNLTTTANRIFETGVNASAAAFSGTTVSGDLINFGCIGY